MLFTVGLDIGKADHGVFARGPSGGEVNLGPAKSAVKKAKVRNDQRSLDVLFAWFAEQAGDDGWVLAIDQSGSPMCLALSLTVPPNCFPDKPKLISATPKCCATWPGRSTNNSAGSTPPMTSSSQNLLCWAVTTKTFVPTSTG